MKIHTRNLGHPLIQSEKCVRNDVDIDNYSCIITGSNMSGKSTFLRAIGMNWFWPMQGEPFAPEN